MTTWAIFGSSGSEVVAKIWLHVEVCNNDIQVCCYGTFLHSVCIKSINSIPKYWKKNYIKVCYFLLKSLKTLCKFISLRNSSKILTVICIWSLLLCNKYLLQFCISEMTGFIILLSTFSDALDKKIDSWCCRRWSFNPIWKSMHKLNEIIQLQVT